jgi:hypothetical protein
VRLGDVSATAVCESALFMIYSLSRFTRSVEHQPIDRHPTPLVIATQRPVFETAVAATPAATGELRSRYVSLEVAGSHRSAVTCCRRCPMSQSADALLSRAWPDDASSAATAKATWPKTVLRPTTLTADMFGYRSVPRVPPPFDPAGYFQNPKLQTDVITADTTSGPPVSQNLVRQPA